MDKKKYSSMVTNANYKSSVWMFVCAVLLLSNLILAVFVISSDTSEKVIVVPPQVDTPFSVQGNKVSTEYIEQMARYFSQLLLTYHKSNAQNQFDTVLHYTDPSIYSSMKTRFDLDYQRISRNDISSVFYLMSIHIKKNVAVITGELNGYVGSHLASKHPKTYELEFKYDGKLTIIGFNEVAKDGTGSYQVVDPVEEMIVESQENIPEAAAPESVDTGVPNADQ